ncbi:transposase [Cylindrospermum stagnale]|uniref:transposase n=1 Tax=Cylindrospermum stagnale TaxID=142864 RepID=UPI00031BAA04|nr:transposase [Cylindrospermum stagnale]
MDWIKLLHSIIVAVIYEQASNQNNLNLNAIANLGIGLDNLVIITSIQAKTQPLLLNPRPLKSVHQLFNKQIAKRQDKTPNFYTRKIPQLCTNSKPKMNDYLDKNSRFIIEYLVVSNISILVIGKKFNCIPKINLGSRNDQNFVQVLPAGFVDFIAYKAGGERVNFIQQEESSTFHSNFCVVMAFQFIISKPKLNINSATSKFPLELYCYACGVVLLIHVNGFCNIMKRAIPNAFAKGIGAVVVQQIRITPGQLVA